MKKITRKNLLSILKNSTKKVNWYILDGKIRGNQIVNSGHADPKHYCPLSYVSEIMNKREFDIEGGEGFNGDKWFLSSVIIAADNKFSQSDDINELRESIMNALNL